jgi:hypothetical protein
MEIILTKSPDFDAMIAEEMNHPNSDAEGVWHCCFKILLSFGSDWCECLTVV